MQTRAFVVVEKGRYAIVKHATLVGETQTVTRSIGAVARRYVTGSVAEWQNQAKGKSLLTSLKQYSQSLVKTTPLGRPQLYLREHSSSQIGHLRRGLDQYGGGGRRLPMGSMPLRPHVSPLQSTGKGMRAYVKPTTVRVNGAKELGKHTNKDKLRLAGTQICRRFSVDKSSGGGAEGEGKLSKFKKMFRKYGPLFVVFYGGLYLTSLSLMYLCVEFGVLGKKKILHVADQVADWLKSIGLDGHLDKMDSKAGNFAIAWIATKLTEPLRFAVSVYCVPKLARFLKYK